MASSPQQFLWECHSVLSASSICVPVAVCRTHTHMHKREQIWANTLLCLPRSFLNTHASTQSDVIQSLLRAGLRNKLIIYILPEPPLEHLKYADSKAFLVKKKRLVDSVLTWVTQARGAEGHLSPEATVDEAYSLRRERSCKWLLFI